MSTLHLTVGWLAAAVAGRIVSGDAEQLVGNIVTDSRSLQSGDFFVALKGPRFDGHGFVGDVIARGARGAMVEAEWWAANAGAHPTGDAARPAIVEVGDTTVALQHLAHAVREAAATKVIAITGSAGKTTTKDTIADFLSGSYRVVKNRGNLNNHIGLPLSLLQLRDHPDVAVMELGMNHAGEISTLVAIADPDVRVWTNVGDAHLGFFESPDAIADAKGEILEGAEPQDVLVCNADDPHVMARARQFAGRIVTFGEADGASVRATAIEDRGIDGMRARVTTAYGEGTLETPLLGRGNLSNVLAATAVALDFGIPLDTVADRATRLRASDRRGAVHRLRGGVTLVDDSYNSSPTALKRALDVIAKEGRAARRVAVLGEMLELGAYSADMHRQCGRVAATAGLAALFAVGGAPARDLADAAVAAGMDASAVRYFESSGAAAPAIAAAIRAGDVVLVKGSRGTRTDLIADRIAEEFA
ncbi:MAG TPA: UDP-N-acetylmuramoyl-tripeptide--D-alanyl-D-alanine ligase [Vicinamibacterales bacterium]|nr:UDP-N-acetylmuramoyl-tripeptide--D-alanyl-D-alanine ligase [Vicinamibacterales bacterium]